MKTLVFFNSENDFREYAKKEGMEYANEELDFANEGQDYYAPFREIEGCEVLYVLGSEGLRMCIRWKGVTMRADIRYRHYDEKTYAFRLCDETDWQGISEYQNSVSTGDVPNQIGKPTAKKLDAWREYLMDLRRREEESRDRAFARMTAKIAEVKKNFPEAKAVTWKNGYWTFEKIQNGLVLTVQVESNGKIYEKLDFASGYQQDYDLTATERAAYMMQNGLEGVKPLTGNYSERYAQMSKTQESYVSQFMGGRPF